MANKISKIPVLEKLLKNRYHKVDGKKIEIGHFWSVLQIYLCMRNYDISLNTICEVASMIDGRLDAKHRTDESSINPRMIRKYLTLEASPSQISHTVVTKTVAKGIGSKARQDISKILMDNNSYGEDILNKICNAVDNQAGEFICSKYSVMGGSPFIQVLKVALLLHEMHKNGKLPKMSEVKNDKHISTIIKTIRESHKDDGIINGIGDTSVFELQSK